MKTLVYFETSRSSKSSSLPMDSKSVCGTRKSPKTFGHEPRLCLSSKWGGAITSERPVQLLREQSCHVSLAETDNVGEKQAAVFLENFAGAENGFLLILQLLESVGNVDVFQFGRAVQLIPEVLVQEFEIKLIGREMSERRTVDDGVFVRLRDIHGHSPKLVKLGDGEIIVGAVFQFDVELKIVLQARIG